MTGNFNWSYIYNLFVRGDVVQVKSLLDNYTNEKFSGKEKQDYDLAKASYYLKTGNFVQALALIEILKAELDKDHELELFLRVTNVYLEILWRKGDFSSALSQGLSLYSELRSLEKKFSDSFKVECANLQFNIGYAYYFSGIYSSSFPYFEQALRIYEEIAEYYGIAKTLNALGNIYVFEGNYSESLMFYEKSLHFFRQLNNMQNIGSLLSNIGGIYQLQGNYLKAKEFYENSYWIRREFGNSQDIGISLKNLGEIYYLQGDFDKSLDAFSSSLKLYNKIENPVHIIENLYKQVILHLELHLSTNNLIAQIKDLMHKYESNNVVRIYSRLSEALILKESPRLKDKIQALEILEKLKLEPEMSIEPRIDMYKYLADLYILELQTDQSNQIWNNLHEVLEKLLTIGKEQHVFPVYIEASILQSRIYLLKDDLIKAREYLMTALTLAKDKKLNLLINKVNSELSNLDNKIKRLITFTEENVSFIERMKEVELLNYFKVITKIKSESTEKPNEGELAGQ